MTVRWGVEGDPFTGDETKAKRNHSGEELEKKWTQSLTDRPFQEKVQGVDYVGLEADTRSSTGDQITQGRSVTGPGKDSSELGLG